MIEVFVEYIDYIFMPWWFFVAGIFALNWIIPFCVSYFFAALFWAFDFYCCAGFYKGVPVLEVVHNGSWHSRAWSRWGGLALFWIIFLKPHSGQEITLRHEHRHVCQALVLGLLQPALYLLFTLFIFFFRPHMHPYLDNPFERDARRYAGQTVDIAESNWPNGRDRWPWW